MIIKMFRDGGEREERERPTLIDKNNSIMKHIIKMKIIIIKNFFKMTRNVTF